MQYFSGNKIEFEITGNTPNSLIEWSITCDFYGGNISRVYNFKSYADSTGKITVLVHDILHQLMYSLRELLLDADFNSDAFTFVEFDIKIGTVSKHTGQCYFGKPPIGKDFSHYFDNRLALSNRPLRSFFAPNQPLGLAIIPASFMGEGLNLWRRMVCYNEDGSTVLTNTDLQFPETYSSYYPFFDRININQNYERVEVFYFNRDTITNDNDYLADENMSVTYTFLPLKNLIYPVRTFWFRNSVGQYDTLVLFGKRTKTLKAESETYQRYNDGNPYNRKEEIFKMASETVEQSSGFMNPSLMNFAKEMLVSNDVFEFVNGQFLSIKLTEEEIKYFNDINTPEDCSFTFKYNYNLTGIL